MLSFFWPPTRTAGIAFLIFGFALAQIWQHEHIPVFAGGVWAGIGLAWTLVAGGDEDDEDDTRENGDPHRYGDHHR